MSCHYSIKISAWQPLSSILLFVPVSGTRRQHLPQLFLVIYKTPSSEWPPAGKHKRPDILVANAPVSDGERNKAEVTVSTVFFRTEQKQQLAGSYRDW